MGCELHKVLEGFNRIRGLCQRERTGNLLEEAQYHGRGKKDINTDLNLFVFQNRQEYPDTPLMISICGIRGNIMICMGEMTGCYSQTCVE